MKLGISTYSLHKAFTAGEMTILEVLDYIASIGGEHAEIVPLGFDLVDDPALVSDIRKRAESLGIALSNYAIGANFAGLQEAELEVEIARVKKEVEVCNELGITKMRHDAAALKDISIGRFLAELPAVTEACREIADYAKPYGITTSVENHGFFLQHSDRVQTLVNAVDRDNFRVTLDVGNSLCADENPAVAVANNLKLASMVHVKDFYVRAPYRNPGEGWFRSSGGSWLRGAIVGQGDIDMPHVLRTVKESGYDGYISIEFEGMEDCRKGAKLGFDYVKKMWAEL